MILWTSLCFLHSLVISLSRQFSIVSCHLFYFFSNFSFWSFSIFDSEFLWPRFCIPPPLLRSVVTLFPPLHSFFAIFLFLSLWRIIWTVRTRVKQKASSPTLDARGSFSAEWKIRGQQFPNRRTAQGGSKYLLLDSKIALSFHQTRSSKINNEPVCPGVLAWLVLAVPRPRSVNMDSYKQSLPRKNPAQVMNASNHELKDWGFCIRFLVTGFPGCGLVCKIQMQCRIMVLAIYVLVHLINDQVPLYHELRCS